MKLINQITANGITYSIIKMTPSDKKVVAAATVETNKPINGCWVCTITNCMGHPYLYSDSFTDRKFVDEYRRKHVDPSNTYATQKEAELSAELMAYMRVFTNRFRQVSTECGEIASVFDMNDQINKVLNKKSD